jgi:hypothetical protein
MDITPWVPLNPAVDDGVTLSNALNIKIPELEAAIAEGGSNDFNGTVTITDPNTPRLELHQPDLSSLGFRISISGTETILESFARPIHYRIDGVSRWIIEQNRLQGRVQTLDVQNPVSGNAGDVTLGFQNFDGSDRVRIFAQPGGGLLFATLGTVRITIASDGTMFTGAISSSGDHTITKVNPQLTLNKSANNENAAVVARTAGSARWVLNFSNSDATTGNNAGDNFRIDRYDDAGNFLGSGMWMGRALGNTLFYYPLSISPPNNEAALNLVKPRAGLISAIYGSLPTGVRWRMDLGNDLPETGANAGSDFAINSFTDAGAYLSTPFKINRKTGVADFAHPPTVNGAALGGAGGWSTIQVLRIPAGTSPVLDFPLGYEAFRLSFINMETTVNQEMFFRVSLDNGETFLSGATDYWTQGAVWAQAAGSTGWANRSYAGLAFSLIPPGFPNVMDAIFLPGSATRQCVYSARVSGWTWTTGAAQSSQLITSTLNRVGRVNKMQVSVVNGNYQSGTIIVEGLPNAAALTGTLPAAPPASAPPLLDGSPLGPDQKIGMATMKDTAALEKRIHHLETLIKKLTHP